jgi:hypothetical protein
VAAFDVEAFRWLEVEEVPPDSVPMLHKDGTSVRRAAEGHTGDKR